MDDLVRHLNSTPVVTAIAAVALALLISRGIRRLLKRLTADGHISALMEGRFQGIRRWAVFIVTCLVVLQTTGMFGNAWALLSAMLATIAIGFFAAWSILSNVTAALLILTFRPFRHGDQVDLVEPTNGTQVSGKVVDINMMYTSLQERDPETRQTSTLYIPNSLFFQKLVRTRSTSYSTPATPFYAKEDAEDELGV